MLGAMIGDIMGSAYEAYEKNDQPIKPFEPALPQKPTDLIVFLSKRMNGRPSCTDDMMLYK